MISRRALFAGAAGAVVAASPAGRALAAPLPVRLNLLSDAMAVFPSVGCVAVGSVVDLIPQIYRTEWVGADELQKRFPRAD